MCPYGGRIVTGEGSWFAPGTLVGHCLLIETRNGLVLVDTGFGSQDLADPRNRLGRSFLATARPALDPNGTALAQVRALGFSADDVQDIVLTHMDLDHAGGLSDFPNARVHIHGTELDAATKRTTWIERERYRTAQWSHGPRWVRHDTMGDRWMHFDAVRAVEGTDAEVLLIPLHGHTRGHCAVAVKTPARWLLHCGDGYFHRDEMRARDPWCPAVLSAYQSFLALDEAARRANQARLRALVAEKSSEVRVFCAHDAVDFALLVAESEMVATATPPEASPPA